MKLDVPLNAKPPLIGTLAANASASFSVRALRVGAVDPPRMPSFNIIPAQTRPATAPPQESIPAMEEIVLDRDILDPSPWIGGQIEKNGIRANILALRPAVSGSSGSRVRVGANQGFAAGDMLTFHPANPPSWRSCDSRIANHPGWQWAGLVG